MDIRGLGGTVLALGLVGGALGVWAYSENKEAKRKYRRKRRVTVYGPKGSRVITLPQR